VRRIELFVTVGDPYNAPPMATPSRPITRRLVSVAAWTAIGTVVVVAVGAVAFWFAMKADRRTTTVVVPDLIGVEMAEAERRAAERGLEVEVVDERNDPVISSGSVLVQEPVPGAQVRRGRRVRVVRSLGSRIVRVPSMGGRPAREVALRLRQEGFEPGDEARAFERSAEPGTVIAQVPPPDSPAMPGARVHRLVSAGRVPSRWVMPDLTGRPAARVQAWIDLCGFRRGVVRKVPADGRASGVVVGQLPLRGYPVADRGIVELTVTE